MYPLLADAVLLLHAAFVLFVVLGLPLILLGGYRRWRWVRNIWFRLGHLGAIGVVVAQAWAGVICPLTTLEMWFRTRAGGVVYEGSFVQYWVHRLIFYDAPSWVFIVIYSLFAIAVLASWWWVPPRGTRHWRIGTEA